MKLSAPKKSTWWIAVIVGGVGIVSHFVAIPIVSPWNFWLTAVGLVLLALSTSLKNI